jgi:hypothetical protein
MLNAQVLEGEEMAKPYNLLSYNSQGEPAVEQLAHKC